MPEFTEILRKRIRHHKEILAVREQRLAERRKRLCQDAIALERSAHNFATMTMEIASLETEIAVTKAVLEELGLLQTITADMSIETSMTKARAR